MKIRIKFRKYGVMKFIGHLDMMRFFQKAMRRAEIDICYSEGFSPHQIMSFAAPAGVGITSGGEYLDIEVHSSRTSAESLRVLNDVMVEGVEIISYRKLPDDAKTAMSIVAAAGYTVTIKDGYTFSGSGEDPRTEAFRRGLESFFARPAEVLVTKQTKKSEKTLDLKKLVYEFRVEERCGRPAFFLMVSTGSTDNLKPELVLEAYFASMGIPWKPEALQIHREDIYARAGVDTPVFVSLGETGEILI